MTPKKKQLFNRAIQIINILDEEPNGLTGKDIGQRMGITAQLARTSCTKLVKAGVLESRNNYDGYRLIKKSIKVGHFFNAFDIPVIETGNSQVDAAFEKYLTMEVFSV